MSRLTQEEQASLRAAFSRGIGLYRAEYLGERLFELFARPSYWEKLGGLRPVFLVGGRGTGKTHALRALAFHGQQQLAGPDIASWETIGFYWRVETNAVAAFRGARLSEEDWIRLFSHFVNLQLVRLILEFVNWREAELSRRTTVDSSSLGLAAISLGLQRTGDINAFAEAVREEIVVFEHAVNRVAGGLGDVNVSMLGKPIEHLLKAFARDEELAGKFYTFCIDEYENLEDYQQKVLNTLVKHVGDGAYTFKIGMRETGLRVRATLSPNEFLAEPADFISVDVVEELKVQGFEQFAQDVCARRLSSPNSPPLELSGRYGLFPDLSEDEEARILGVEARNRETRRALEREGASTDDLRAFDAMSVLSAYLVDYWARSEESSRLDVLRQALGDPRAWEVRLGNYSYAMLFTIRRGKAGHKKLYSGWSTIAHLADGNVRYLLNLVTLALEAHVAAGNQLDVAVPASIQTDAAMEMGSNMVRELQGLDVRGAQLTRLALGLGRVFGVFAADPYGHTPEVAQFRVREDTADANEVNALLNAGVMHSCLKRFAGDKMALVSPETKEFDYQLHPIFAPFFVYSHRSKRRMTLPATDLLELSSHTSREAIAKILKRANRSKEVELPEQLTLFSEHFYELA